MYFQSTSWRKQIQLVKSSWNLFRMMDPQLIVTCFTPSFPADASLRSMFKVSMTGNTKDRRYFKYDVARLDKLERMRKFPILPSAMCNMVWRPHIINWWWCTFMDFRKGLAKTGTQKPPKHGHCYKLLAIQWSKPQKRPNNGYYRKRFLRICYASFLFCHSCIWMFVSLLNCVFVSSNQKQQQPMHMQKFRYRYYYVLALLLGCVVFLPLHAQLPEILK